MWTSAETGGGGRFTPHAALDDGAHDNAFDLPPLDAFPFPRHTEPSDDREKCDALTPFPSFPTHQKMEEAYAHGDDMSFDEQRSVHSDQFVDAEAFMADHKPGEDSFLRETTGRDDANVSWSDNEEMDDVSDRRASAIFVPKSRNMENVEFSSPKRTIRKGISVHHEAPLKMNVRANFSNRASNAAFSATNTALSSEYDIHVDNRLVLTPNSFKYLQQRERQPTDDFALSHANGSTHDSAGVNYSFQAKQVVDATAAVLSEVPRVAATPERPSSAEKAMHSGPGVIKKALHEIESMLRPMSFDDGDSEPESNPALEKLKSRLRQILPPVRTTNLADESAHAPDPNVVGQDFHEEVTKPEMKSKRMQADRSPVSDASVHRTAREQITHDRPPKYASRTQGFKTAHEQIDVQETGAMRISSLRSQRATPHTEEDNAGSSASKEVKVTSPPTRYVRTADASTQPEANATDSKPVQEEPVHSKRPARPKEGRPETSFRRASLQELSEAPFRTIGIPERENLDVNLTARIRTQARREHTKLRTVQGEKNREGENTSIKATVNSLPLATAVPSQMARRCRRFLCTVGERMSEQIVFSNGSSKVGRICVSLLPLSTGCQQFSVSPAVLELQPRSRSAFTVRFEASRPGVVAGIFQFRAVGVDGLFEPYEVLIEASVRGDLQLPPQVPRPKAPKFPAQAIKSISQESRVTELPAQALAGVKITPTFLRYSKTSDDNGRDVVVGGSSIRLTNTTAESVHFQLKSSHEHLQLSQARGQLPAGSEVTIEVSPICRPFGLNEDGTRDWCGSMTVIVGDVLSREVSIVIDRNALAVLPTFDEAARVRQAISAQTDSFYYTKKVNRRGLYFHARAVECGSCVVGESHQVPVYICNGSEAPMTVFLQALQEPFSCEYQPTTLQARKFIEVPVTFRPKATGKVATCLVAYTVSGKAAVTLIARGIDKAAVMAQEHI